MSTILLNYFIGNLDTLSWHAFNMSTTVFQKTRVELIDSDFLLRSSDEETSTAEF